MHRLRTTVVRLRPIAAPQTAKSQSQARLAAVGGALRTFQPMRSYTASVSAEPFLNGTSSNYVEEMYYAWLENPRSVHKVRDCVCLCVCVCEMAEHIDDLDNRGRRCNIRVVGLSENSEGSRSVKFFEEWIPGYLQMDTKARCVKLDRAHRSQTSILGPNQRPRPVAIKFHNFPRQAVRYGCG
ncbi:unnamed protein product [Oncorhynchus mykiss]|uniref:2-oxoglutarate dehydrogenase E1 component N-terminal domain-containing protein n=1 Tax=Oncorhynchus mykiss TaxID=8022 RepID=A0A060XG89_ONCMY|nr:unnamed protein product [Oncorhynchus mykiss]